MIACLKLSRFVKVAIEARRAFHWTTAKGKVFVVVSPSVNLPVCQWVGSARHDGQGDDVWRERHCDISMYYFIEKDESWVSTPLLKGTLAEFSQHVWDTWIWWVSTQDPPSCQPQDHLDFLCVFKSLWVSDWSSILQLGTNNGLVSSFPKFGFFGLEVPSQETKRLVCSICYPGDMGFPWQIATNLIFETEWGRLVFLDRSRTEMMSTLQVKMICHLTSFVPKTIGLIRRQILVFWVTIYLPLFTNFRRRNYHLITWMWRWNKATFNVN